MEKHNKDDENDKKISKFQTFKELYKQSPAMKALIKLFLYFIFFSIIISVVAMSGSNTNDSNNEQLENKPTSERVEKSYRDILNEVILKNNKYNYEIINGEEKSIINYSLEESGISGFYENANSIIKKFIIKDDNVYEVVLKEERENNSLFEELNLNIINIYRLIDLILNNKGIKMLENDCIIYKYSLNNLEINVNVKAEKIENIDVLENNIHYFIKVE